MASQPVTRIELRTPYLIFLGDVADPSLAKTGFGLARWCPDRCLGQLRLPDGVDIGLEDLEIAEAVARGARSIVLGVAPVGGSFSKAWGDTLASAARAGLDVVAGMHGRLSGIPGLADAATEGGGRLVDVRVPPPGIPVGTGRRRSGRRLLTVGTDCAIGKKYAALAITAELRRRGVAATFRATGQTGIMIAGEGIPVDTVVADFVAGAAEVLSPDNDPDHWDVIEGQGALQHPAYGAVSLGLLFGSQPDAIVLCHDAARTHLTCFADFPLPELAQCIQDNERLARRVNPSARCIGISVNTSSLDPASRGAWLADLAAQTGLPCVDPIVDGPGTLVDALRLDRPAPSAEASR